jgi:protease IV
MTRLVKSAAVASLLVAAAPATAQVRNALDRQAGFPAGLALPVPGVAVAEDPAGMGTTPAAPGFVDRLALEYFREGNVTEDSEADGLYAAAGLGPLGVGYSIEWVRPGEATPDRRYRKNALALALGDGRSSSVGFAWNTFSSPDPGIEAVSSWDVGLTVRPWRHLSIGLASLDHDARLDGQPLPVRYDFGLASRFRDDTYTLSADLLADDRAKDDFHATHLAFGAGADFHSGIALALQILVPISDEPGQSRDPSAVVSLSWNGPHFGLSGGVTGTPDRTGGFGGVRVSGERYRAPESGDTVPEIDVQDALERKTFFVFAVGDRDPYGLLLRELAALKSDASVGAVAVKIEGLPLGSGRTEELRAALAAVAARRPVLAYLASGGTAEYWLATGATAIAVPPGSTVQVNGIGTSRLFLKDALAKLGVAFEVVARGAYKSAPEPLVREGSSPESREVTNALLDDVFGRFVADVSAARTLPAERVRALVDQGLFSSAEAKDAGLVDEVLWPDELEGWARRVTRRRVRLAGDYAQDPERRAQRWGRPPVIAVVRVEGAIVSGKSRSGGMGRDALAGAETVSAAIKRAAADREVKAIVLRVDSPGGDGLASDLIWREVVRARAKKPVIASMGDSAASGGYLVAVGADAIVAEPSTLTGSIGVFALKPDLSGLLAKLTVQREQYARGQNAGVESVMRPWTASERAAVEKQIETFYALFVDRVAEGRKLPRAEIEPLAGGRVWTGRQAFDRRLVDRLGSLEDALALARERAHLAPDEPVEVRRAGGGTDLGTLVGDAVVAAAPASRLADALLAVPEVRALALLSEMGVVLALPVDWVRPGN